LARSVPLSRFTSQVGGGSAFFVRHHRLGTVMSRMSRREKREYINVIPVKITPKPSFAGYTISTSCWSDMDGVYGIAYCPICDACEESSQYDHDCDKRHAINESVGRIRTHMALVHKLKDNVDA
jgi:hypothetical protein